MMNWINAALILLLGSGCGVPGGPSVILGTSEPEACPISDLKLTTNQAASFVIGQSNLSSGSWVSTTASSVKAAGPVGIYHGLLLVPDNLSNRILGFYSIPTTDGPNADFILGQSTVTGNASGTSATSFSGPEGVSFSGTGQMAFADVANHRVLIYNEPPITAGVAADVVVGQPNFGSSTPGVCSRTSLYSPESVFIGHGKLIVADESNSRVMIWNTIPATSGAPADLVLGQADYTHCLFNAGGAVSASSFNAPQDVWTDGEKLIVADGPNHRVLIWNKFPTVINQPADIVLGQTSFTVNTQNAGTGSVNRLGMDYPYFVDSNGTQVVVSEQDNNRVLIWNTFPLRLASYLMWYWGNLTLPAQELEQPLLQCTLLTVLESAENNFLSQILSITVTSFTMGNEKVRSL